MLQLQTLLASKVGCYQSDIIWGECWSEDLLGLECPNITDSILQGAESAPLHPHRKKLPMPVCARVTLGKLGRLAWNCGWCSVETNSTRKRKSAPT